MEAIKLAHFLDLFTIAFVVDAEQARKMTLAGADVICAHLGLTKGGFLGAKSISLSMMRERYRTRYSMPVTRFEAMS